jgi:hypothetical protein
MAVFKRIARSRDRPVSNARVAGPLSPPSCQSAQSPSPAFEEWLRAYQERLRNSRGDASATVERLMENSALRSEHY